MTTIFKAGFGATLVLAAGVAAANAEAEFTMRIAAGASSTGNVCNDYLDAWGDRIREASGGRIDYELTCDGALVGMGNAVDRVAQGVADVAWDLPGVYGARFAGINVIGVPGLYTDNEPASGALWQAYESGALGTISDVRVLWFQAVPNNSFFMLEPHDDYVHLNGIQMGMGSQIRAAILEAMGGVPVALRVPEYYQAMQRGTVQGLMTTAGAVFDFSVDELIHEVFEAPFGGGVTFTVMSNDFYNSLPADLQAVIDANSGYDQSRWASAFLRDNEAAQLTTLENVNIREATDEELAALQPAIEAGRSVYLASAPENAGYLAAIEAALQAQ
ncbi:MAG: TRAP transporter substrate-binding protein DctP [Rhodobacteraceae bacterium]|nr:TRAP transporter substrate-binding protein DctP [Paracoccaceae bacterium]